MVQRRVNRWVGVFLLVVGVGGLALTFPPSLLLGVQMALLAVAGALVFASGVTDRVRWSILAGLGNVALGLSLVVSGVTTLGDQPGTGDLAYGALVAVGGLTLAVIGVGYVVEHDAFDTEP
ncbi:uncharacterized protein HHUB_1487 [Halobacterium hubeiense]|uniref:Uncharacterized protein n=1 Tax=Halobacterium hubeiense TaxID=1407499 RepID=A0A0U5H2L6_9EURY|nr:hypothetical protein [Halobacterium hubeiense]CQH49098.1 uncharacterized protein HHUB_1487 [Halobacterium hubeiense]